MCMHVGLHKILAVALFLALSFSLSAIPVLADDSGDSSAEADESTETPQSDIEYVEEFSLSGTYRINFALENKEVDFKDANYLLQEKGWRYLYGEKRHNTFDPAVYNQLKMDIFVPITETLSFSTKVSVDPWSFVGTTQAISLDSWYGTTNAGDPVELKLKYWSNSARTYPEIVRSNKGDSFALPEIKVVNGKTSPASVQGNWGDGTSTWMHKVDIPQLKVDEEFKPLRSLLFDLKEEEYRARFFIYAEEDMGFYSDDPLHLCNNHILWEPSPWFNRWKPGRFYSSSGWEDGYWYRDLTLKDSEGNWLTFLRGARIAVDTEEYEGTFMIAAPLDIWDDYSTVDSVPMAVRIKKDMMEYLTLGTTYTARLGYDNGSLDAFTQAMGIDSQVIINEANNVLLEAALSREGINLSNDERSVHSDDGAYKAVYLNKLTPFELTVYSNFSYTYMGRDFGTPLANYSYTRDDQGWGKHISFSPRSREEENYRIGNSIDKDRKIAACEISFGDFEGMSSFLNFRNVARATDNKFIENIVRNETAYRVNDQMLAKFLFLFNQRTKTDAGKSQDTYTFSAAAKYNFAPELSFEEILERTNEYPGFPDGIYSWLDINPAAPYPYYNIAKSRLLYTPWEWLEMAFENAYNEFEYAATLDDFMNYSGLDSRIYLTDECELRLVYRYSRVADYLQNGKVIGHHNFYLDLAYDVSENAQLIIQYSELGNYIKGLGWQNSVLDTQHLVRVIYKGKF